MPKKLKTEWDERDLVPIIKDWFKRMRSMKYKQTIGRLRGRAVGDKGTGNCCLGLLCDAMAAKGYGKWRGNRFKPSVKGNLYDESLWKGGLSVSWRQKLKMYARQDGNSLDLHMEGVDMNDQLDAAGKPCPVPFPLIADEAERYYKSIGVL